MSLLIFFFVSAISISFLCSVMEAALLSISPSYIASLEEKNYKLFKKVSFFKANIDTPLAAILTLNTVAHTVGATGVGAQVAALYGQGYLGLASGVMTLAILVLSEIIPKTIGASYWKKLIPSMCLTLDIMIFILKPILIVSEWITRWFGNSEETANISDELRALAKMGKEEKSLDENKFRVINNVLNLHEVKVKDIMTPRIVVHSVKPEMTIQDFEKFIPTSPFSRFPIVDEEEENFLGYIHKSSAYKANENQLVCEFSNNMETVYSEAPIENVLTTMLNDHNHLALVVDQHGTWVGIISLEDIIETILGKEIVDESDIVDDMQLYAKMKWKKRIEQQKKPLL